MPLAPLVPLALALSLVAQDREVDRLTKQALDRDPVESRAAIEHLAAFGERGVPGLGTVLAKGEVLARSVTLVELRELGGVAVAILPELAELLPAREPAPAEDLELAMDDQARAARTARINVMVEKSMAQWSGAAWDKRELELFEAALAADALCAVARADLAAGVEACLEESKRARRVKEGYETSLVALARAARAPEAEEDDAAEEEASEEAPEEEPEADTGEEPDETLAALVPYLTHEDELARHLALAAFAGAGERAAFARDEIAALLADRDKAVAARAAEALAAVGGDGATLGPLLAPLASDRDGGLAVHAARAWWSVCPDDPAPREALRACLGDRDPQVRATAVMGLARLVVTPEEADLEAFTEALADRKPLVRMAAARAAKVGAAHLQALRPALQEASVNEKDLAIASALTEALKEMR